MLGWLEESRDAVLKKYDRYFFVYIMAGKSRWFDAGMTESIIPRVLEHKSGEIDGFTRRNKVLGLV